MIFFCFEKYVYLHFFRDKSGFAVFNGCSGDTFFVKSLSSETSQLYTLQHLLRFTAAEFSQALGIDDNEAAQTLDFLLVNKLVVNVSEI
ncbi:hypothetical protein GCM10008111_06880 [Alishewanella tabrizica]|uniref:PqqD family protein n=1 Tax=Alishewanella tabrizica TaxID=671278 RepID=A0ABQ2WF57_9ALTE|nr:hypothetical protein GCM10008111_06880 [Alishewanella tabrizica]